MTSSRLAVLLALASLAACKRPPEQTPVGLVVDAGPTTASTEPKAVDINQCPGCQLAPQQSWEFAGIYRDDQCTDPLAQIAPPACAVVPALGATSVTYVDEVGGRKAGESANVTLTEQVGAQAARYRKTAKGCVRANEAAVDITPTGCGGSRVCRDANGALVCTGCRLLSTGCPDFEETRLYAAIDDPVAKGAKPGAGGGGGGNVARLRQCCAALAAEAKRLGASPEAGLINTAAAQCNALVTAAGPNGNAPELGAIRTMLAGRNVPAICAGF